MELKVQISQTQVLSQKMIQSAEILQMSSQELENYMKELALENPVVDLEEQTDSTDRDEELKRKIEWLESSDEQNRVYYSNDYTEDGERDPWNFNADDGESLAEYLMSQLLTKGLNDRQMRLAEYMVNCLDDKGYFKEDCKEIADKFKESTGNVEKVLALLKTLEPAGICAESLSECLLLQLDRKQVKAPALRIIIKDYLELVGKNQLHVIAKKMKLPVETILKECEMIKGLNPKPGSSFCSRETLRYITPDVTVVKLSGYYEILLNEYMYPRMSVNGYYKKMLTDDAPKEAKDYISGKIRQAEWVMNCISQRNKTLLSVTKAIVDNQEAFFLNGPGALKPMKQADIAAVLDIHESTVSRAVRDKYVQCSWGIFPMNYFFSKGVSALKGSKAVTPEYIKRHIQEIISAEDKKKPYSDRIIGEKLEERGISLSRRTVAKYREEMGIKDASGRKKFVS